MRLTKQTNYAIRMLMYCDSSKGLSRVSSIANFYSLSEQFLLKILQVLTKSGLMESVRGRNGGIRLARPASEIGLGEVVRITEENFELAECFQDGDASCPLVTSCGLNHALSKALNAFFAVLDEYTLADLTNNERNLHVLLQLEASKNIPLESQTRLN
ncbi:MAG: iron-responsive transcriptional regulator [Hyphomicrobiales bacterium]|nr:MAG: iron-responsive transcriptional regulator [Hyphomicrobiales bacterium]